MIAVFLLLVIVAIALGLVGVVVKGLLFLLFIGIAVFLVDLILAAVRMHRRLARQPTRLGLFLAYRPDLILDARLRQLLHPS